MIFISIHTNQNITKQKQFAWLVSFADSPTTSRLSEPVNKLPLVFICVKIN
uniref:Uncharacterized protein n=1 Tax=Rhizophora mucronata TaxID=61149 RepID=A0A2P2IPX4_RHIMU